VTAAEFDVFNCNLDGISLIEASAGTGKTWNICGIYLRLLLEREFDVQQILVVTFTNTATAELRDRIRTRIVDMLACIEGEQQAIDDPFIAGMIGTLEQKHGISRAVMAGRLNLALQNFDEASIFTIHGFCQRALANSAFSSGQAFSLELLPDDSELMTEVVHDFWRRHIAGEGMGPELATWLIQQNLTPDKLVPLLRRELAKPLAKTLWPDDIDQPLNLDSAGIACAYDAAHISWQEHRDTIEDLLLAAKGHINGRNYTPASIAKGRDGFDAYFRCGDPLAVPDKNCDLFSTARLIEKTNANKVTPKHAFFDLAESMLDLREDIGREMERAYLQLIKKLLQEKDAIRQRKKDQRLLAYDDILYNLYAVMESGDYPWMAGSIRQRFPAALIDEFQDTDPLQFSIFNSIYGGAENPVFFVGDPKQAIYSFRNADLNAYLDAQRITTARYTLKQNQRSTKGLIDALNTLFSANPKTFMLPGLDYVPVALGSKPRKPFLDHSAPHAELQLWMLPKDENGMPVERSLAKNKAAEATAGEIARLLAASRNGEISIAGQALRAADIAVLVRSHAQGSAIRQALAARNIGSVELSQRSVYLSPDAGEIVLVLAAILMPARESWLRAALATEIIGCNAAEIAATSVDSGRLTDYVDRFSEYRTQWLRRGIGFMFRHLLTQEGVSARMLCRPDGERRLTNLLHLGELLHQAAETHDSPEALLRWLQTRRSEEKHGEEAQQRLDSDRKLVQIVTIHKSKGMEYAVVFCPFLWDNVQLPGRGMQGHEYHDDDGKAVIDFRSLSDEETKQIRSRIRQENTAETLRLIYVALTRAVYRCYLLAGCYSRKTRTSLSTSESVGSLLNWLVAGDRTEPQHWPVKDMAPAEIELAWNSLKARCGDHISLMPMPSGAGSRLILEDESQDALTTAPLPSSIPGSWKISSFSGMTLNAVSEIAASDHDVRIQALEILRQPEVRPGELDQDDILLFPRGPDAGNCIHAAFENCDFTDPSGWDQAVENALLYHPQEAGSLKNISQAERHSRLKDMMLRMMNDVTRTYLPGGIRLGDVGLARRMTELEFYLPSSELAPAALNRMLQELGYTIPRLAFGKLQGYLKGFIDLVFEHSGRYYILDWKSNHLGYSCADYREQPVAESMAEHGYHLQYLLYTVALNRYLAQRIPDYDYETHFGGVLYLFVRGIRANWRNAADEPCGVYFHRPDQSAIEQIDAVLAPQTGTASC